MTIESLLMWSPLLALNVYLIITTGFIIASFLNNKNIERKNFLLALLPIFVTSGVILTIITLVFFNYVSLPEKTFDSIISFFGYSNTVMRFIGAFLIYWYAPKIERSKSWSIAMIFISIGIPLAVFIVLFIISYLEPRDEKPKNWKQMF